MRRCFYAVLVSSVVLGLVGCEDDSTPNPEPKTGAPVVQPSPSSPTPRTPSPSPADANTNAAHEKPVPQSPPPAAPTAPSAATPPPVTAPTQLRIQLSTGVALPQTGPEGTLMAFSVDYEVAQGEPGSESYVWVIERTHGAAHKQKAQLAKKGNLTILVQGWQPENGPFKSHIEDAKGARLSESIEMLQSGI
jgi:hypothetical protein